MAKRKIIKIDQEKCNGCGNCIPNCPEGAIQIIDGKARLINDMFCDGLGACLGECPVGAITIEEREAQLYDEKVVMSNIVKQGENTIKAHLKHLKDHNETKYYNQAIEYLDENGIPIPIINESNQCNSNGGCPGSKVMDFSNSKSSNSNFEDGKRSSELRQWPIQLHLVPPNGSYYQNKEVVIIADCVGYAVGDFHKDYIKGKSIAIACPKLDDGLEIYVEKIKTMIDEAKINTLTVMIMEVPCCGGLVSIAQKAMQLANRKVPLKLIKVSITGDVLDEKWI